MNHFEIHDQQLPAGLIDKGYEFFYSPEDKDIMCSHNRCTVFWANTPKEGIQIVEDDLAKYPERRWCLDDWGFETLDQKLKQYTFCRFGKFDNIPDINEKGEVHDGEFFECGRRGVCKYEGILCATIKVGVDEQGNAISLTKRETQILKLVSEGKLNKEISDILGISEHTTSTHIQNIQHKAGLFRKSGMTAFAMSQNLFNL